MNTKTGSEKCIYDCIVIGAGASGLFYAAADSLKNGACGNKLILEKTQRPGQKLLMSGNGMCNITHGGSIKDFIIHYGDHGKLIRSCLYRYNNLELRQMMEALGIPTEEREDGKVFPGSMKVSTVLEALLKEIRGGGWELRCSAEVKGICKAGAGKDSGISKSGACDDSGISKDRAGGDSSYGYSVSITLADGTVLMTRKLVIATGGASYPATGSDGTFYDVLRSDLGLDISKPRPALTPVFVQDFSYEDLSGVSFDDVIVTAGDHSVRGPMLITHKGFSGPAILHISQYVQPGDELRINFLPDEYPEDIADRLKEDQPGNSTGTANYIASMHSLPKAFVKKLLKEPDRKISTLSGKDIDAITSYLTDCVYSVSGTGGWNDAMVTAGGVALDQIDMKTMRIKTIGCDIRVIGEALDVNGDTGGYNLQFAYSSALAAL